MPGGRRSRHISTGDPISVAIFTTMKPVACRVGALGLVFWLTGSAVVVPWAQAEVQSWIQAAKGSPSKVLRGIREMERKGVLILKSTVRPRLLLSLSPRVARPAVGLIAPTAQSEIR
jgi:hypothetical protein